VSTTETVDDVRVVDNRSEHRYEARLGERVVGFSEYRPAGQRLIFTHTIVDPEFEGRGIGSQLAAEALDDVRRRGMTLTAHCPFISAYLERHPEYADLIAPKPPSRARD
jgi:predicted GNAT family acetyltransferase